MGTSSSDTRPEPPVNPSVRDKPEDDGGSIEITWEASFDDVGGRGTVNSYSVFRSSQPVGGFRKVGTVASGRERYSYLDEEVRDGARYYYKVVAETGSGAFSEAGVIGPVVSSAQWFHTSRLNMLVALVVVSASVLFFITTAPRPCPFG